MTLLTFDKSWKFFLRQVIWLGANVYGLYWCPVLSACGIKCSWYSTVLAVYKWEYIPQCWIDIVTSGITLAHSELMVPALFVVMVTINCFNININDWLVTVWIQSKPVYVAAYNVLIYFKRVHCGSNVRRLWENNFLQAELIE